MGAFLSAVAKFSGVPLGFHDGADLVKSPWLKIMCVNSDIDRQRSRIVPEVTDLFADLSQEIPELPAAGEGMAFENQA